LIVARGTNSIQAYVVTIIGVVVFLSIYSFRSSLRYLRGIKYFSFTALFSIIGFFLVILTPSFGFLADVRAKFFYQGSVTQRLEFWRAGLSIFRDNPWFGVGPDQFQRYAALYRTPEQVTRDGVFSIPDKAHSVPIDLLANGGILAGIAWLIFVTLIFLRLIQLMRMDISNDLRRDLSILGGIWSGYIFQALISPDQLVLSVIGFISAGLIINIFRKQKVPKNSSKSRILKTLDINILRVFVATILLFASILWIQSMRTDIRAKEILGKENLNKEEILKAVDEWPAPKTTELIAVAVSGADPGCEILNDISNRMIELDERSAQGWYLQAICRNVKQDFTGALSASDKALEFDPINPVYLVAKAKLGLASQNKLATEAALQVLKNNYPDNPEIKQIEGYLTLISN
jgi:hypothetical protein